MLKIMLNTFKILTKKKSFIIVSILLPAVFTIVFSYMLGQQTVYKIGIINNDNAEISEVIKNRIENIDGVKIENVKENEYESFLASREIELAIVIDKGFSEDVLKGKENSIKISSVSESDIKPVVKSIIEAESKNLYVLSKLAKGDLKKFKALEKEYRSNMPKYVLNEVNNSISVMQSLGIVIMIIFISGQVITRFILDDEENGTKDRILLSNISERNYFAGILTIFFICSSLTSIFYYSICKLLNFNFGMENSTYFLLILLLVNLLSVTFNLCIVSFIKNPNLASNLSVLVIMPTSMLSGAFWDFGFMPESMQRLGNLCPQRWAINAIEKLQEGSSFLEIIPMVLALIMLSIVLFLLSLVLSKAKNKMVP
ncbi:ABC transporter permease [Clostridium septicum]|uniref:ABC transporter permease n=1 Tax=Clostridium septicum TaxID=1504 RepID=A0A9N7JJ31_CLOSE|nr:ABC transporter permease [Clostridium septicum]AYE33583.1 ABC transporter permease [Clostridium septicum]QAS61747.1 ABC transporter permease [Clostridium septicum]UEC21806.1 ABC transporter permease [Clostridium septicum]USS00142.1 ABC transporter permease [Clostridium septicum]WLF68689.1 ABC transporter permease [Clostridium septicum]